MTYDPTDKQVLLRLGYLFIGEAGPYRDRSWILNHFTGIQHQNQLNRDTNIVARFIFQPKSNKIIPEAPASAINAQYTLHLIVREALGS